MPDVKNQRGTRAGASKAGTPPEKKEDAMTAGTDVKPNPTDVKPNPDATPDAESEFDFTSIVPTAAKALPKAVKVPVPNQLLPIVQTSIDNDFKPYQYGPVPNAMLVKVKTLLHRAAGELNVGLKIRTLEIDKDAGTTTLVYQAVKEKKAKQYTIEQVREWFAAQITAGRTFTDYHPTKRISADNMRIFRDENNFTTPGKTATPAPEKAEEKAPEKKPEQ